MAPLKNKYVVFVAIIIGLFFVIFACNCGRVVGEGFMGLKSHSTQAHVVREGFQGWAGMTPKPMAAEPVVGADEVAGLQKRLEAAFNVVATGLCPSFNLVKEEMAKQMDGDEEAAVRKMTEEAGGRIYDCRSYPDHLQVPADIGVIVSNTAAYLYKKLTDLTENVKSALSCKIPNPTQVTESYSDYVDSEGVCSPELMAVRKKEEEKQAALTCQDPARVDNLKKKMMLESRIKSLEGAIKDPAWEPVIGKIRDALKYFMEIKAKIDAGTLMPQCGEEGFR